MPRTSDATRSESPWGPTRRRRENNYPVKREAVLQAAAALMRRNGYEATSLNELAEALVITKPTLYYYFKSKEDLYAEIIDRSQTETLDFMQSIVDSEGSGYEKLRKVMEAYVEQTNSDFGAVLMHTPPVTLDPALARKIRARTREANELIRQILAEGQKDGSLAIGDETIVLHALFGSLNWISRWFKPTGRLPLNKLTELHIDVLLNGIRGPELDAPHKPKRRKGRKE